MSARVIHFPLSCIAEFSVGDLVRLADGRRGYVDGRAFGTGPDGVARVDEYMIRLVGGHGHVSVPRAKVFRWFPEGHTSAAGGGVSA